MNRIGNRLVARGVVHPDELTAALRRQREEGGYLGQLLLDAGALNRQELHGSLAEQWGIAWRDLDQDPPDPAVLATTDVDLCLELGWLPCEVTDRGVVVATTVQPGPDLLLEIEEQFPGTHVDLVACTRRDLDHVVLEVRRRRDRPASGLDRGPGLRLRPCAITGLIAVALLYLVALASIATEDLLSAVLASAGVLFAGGVLGQSLAAVRLATSKVEPEGQGRDEGWPDADLPGADDLLLPVYTVLVAVPEGVAAIERAIATLAGLDYPRSRLDAVLLVPDEALDAVRRAAPPDWVRVVHLPVEIAVDRTRAYDEGLAFARGRYVVAYDPDDVPEPDQLRRAVAEFESDLAACLGARRTHPALMRLDVECHTWVRPDSLASAVDRVESSLGLNRAQPVQRDTADHRPELTSSHFNTRVLRRLGGWSAVTAGAGPEWIGVQSLPTGLLHSSTHHRRARGLRATFRRQVVLAVSSLDAAVARARGVVRAPEAAEPLPAIAATLVGFAAPVLQLTYPVALVGASVFAARAGAMGEVGVRVGAVGVVGLLGGLAVAVGTASVLVGRRHGWRAAGSAVVVPAAWLVSAAAAWHAVVVVLPCRRRRGAPAR